MFGSLLLAALIWFSPPDRAEEDFPLVMFWNLENLFDWRRDTALASPSEEEFTSLGKKHWTRRKFSRKCQAIAKTILWIADGHGRLPDIIGAAEVENSFVLKKLTEETVLRKYGYAFIQYDSPDPRGIDVALLYRKDILEPLDSKPLAVTNPNKDGPPLLTRDILLAKFRRPAGDSLAVLVNHHPSKYGEDSGWRREAAMTRLEEITDSLLAAGTENIVAMGDFNDTPESTSGYSSKMKNMALPLARKGLGTIKYSGKWEMIDMFFISPALARNRPGSEMRVEKVPFLMVKDNTHSGEKPLRTYTGPRYTGGVSDHCPITLAIK